MRNKVKGFILGLMIAAAVSSGVIAFAVAGKAEEASGGGALPGEENRYVLRDYEGYVAIFVENEPELPMTVTDIQVSTLRELDRKMLVTGVKVDSHEGLVMLLEDLGS